MLAMSERNDIRDVPQEIWDAAEGVLGILSRDEMDTIAMWVALQKAPVEWIVKAIRRTARAKRPNLAYTLKILESWKEEGCQLDGQERVREAQRARAEKRMQENAAWDARFSAAAEFWDLAPEEIKAQIKRAAAKYIDGLQSEHQIQLHDVFLKARVNFETVQYMEREGLL